MEKIKKLKNLIIKHGLDGYIIPKNDEYFGENVQIHKERLKSITGFSGSAGFSIVLRNKNYLFVDGRYTLQATEQCGKKFVIITLPSQKFKKLFIKNLKIGFDPKLYTNNTLQKIFKNLNCQLIPFKQNFVDLVIKKKYILNIKKAWIIDGKNSGENYLSKIKKIKRNLSQFKMDMVFVSSTECVNWALNIRGSDNQFSPVVNAQMIINNVGQSILFIDKRKISISFKRKLNKIKIIDMSFMENYLQELKGNKIFLDSLSCSIYYENLLRKKNIVRIEEDYIYLLKSKKNKIEIKNILKSHFFDGLALTKFLIWLKKNYKTKKITEIDAEKKLINFRRKNENFLFSSFSTISATASNGAIIHYRANASSNRRLKTGSLYLIDSGGQYKFGTTDVTRTISLENKINKIKDIFTLVLKGHIAVTNYKLSRNSTGSLIDKVARKPLNEINLDYPHGTGHGVGYFLNVHEGPQAISRNNNIKIKEGMIVSNEPGFYLKNKFGIRIENLIYVKKINGKLKFTNLTLAPIDKSLINKKLLNKIEISWLNNYHNSIYKNFYKFMNNYEKNELKKACSKL